MNSLNMGLIGCGYWGKNLYRNLQHNKEINLISVHDASFKKADNLVTDKNIKIFESTDKFFSYGNLKAVVIATPPKSHFKLAKIALEKGISVLIEKPMAMNERDCDELNQIAQKNNCIIMVDHTFLYHPAIMLMKNEIEKESIGELLYYDSVRVNLGGFQPFTNVLWDLAPHDLSILDFITDGKMPTRVMASGLKHYGSDVENICYATLLYENNFMANLNLNWAAPVKSRKIVVGGSQKMMVFDDNLVEEKVKIYDKNVNVEVNSEEDFRINYRVGDMISPVVLQSEPLVGVINSFVSSVVEKRNPDSDGTQGQRVVRILESLDKSLKTGHPEII